MCVFHLKVHTAIEKGLADEQSVLRISYGLTGTYFALGGNHFLQIA
jgi:hypothetical protein